MPLPEGSDAAAPVLLYDGGCGLCAGSVQFLLARARAGRSVPVRFAPLDGTFARALLAREPWLAGVDSVVWVDPSARRPLVRSDAALAALASLGGAWRVAAAAARVVPRALRDRVYNAVARRRHRLVARRCLLPTATDRHRFLP